MSDYNQFPHKAFDRWQTMTPEDYFGEDDEDDGDTHTRCKKCGCLIFTKNLKKHQEEKHNGQK